jgi:hypothetical protein
MASLNETFEAVRSGALKPSQGASMAAIASCWLKAYELSLIETRILDLERQFAQAIGGKHE